MKAYREEQRSIYLLKTTHQRRNQGPVVVKVDKAIRWINLYPVDNAIGFPNTYPLDSDFSGGQRYPTFEQPERGGSTIHETAA